MLLDRWRMSETRQGKPWLSAPSLRHFLDPPLLCHGLVRPPVVEMPRNGKEGELVCRLGLWRKRQPIYTGFRVLGRDAS
jgi:hypothetical protein